MTLKKKSKSINFLPVKAELFHANDKQADRYY